MKVVSRYEVSVSISQYKVRLVLCSTKAYAKTKLRCQFKIIF